jgi:hypothetical protein
MTAAALHPALAHQPHNKPAPLGSAAPLSKERRFDLVWAMDVSSCSLTESVRLEMQTICQVINCVGNFRETSQKTLKERLFVESMFCLF